MNLRCAFRCAKLGAVAAGGCGAFIALAQIGWSFYKAESFGVDTIEAAFRFFPGPILFQAILGLLYGIKRAQYDGVSRMRGTLIGIIVWTAIATPVVLLCIGIVLALTFLDPSEDGENSIVVDAMPYAFIWIAYLLCGASAGFLVERYLLQCTSIELLRKQTVAAKAVKDWQPEDSI